MDKSRLRTRPCPACAHSFSSPSPPPAPSSPAGRSASNAGARAGRGQGRAPPPFRPWATPPTSLPPPPPAVTPPSSGWASSPTSSTRSGSVPSPPPPRSTGCFRLVPDHLIPGTLLVGHALPTVAQAIIYITVIQVDTTTLVLLIAASVLGAWLGAGVVASWPKRAVQIGMGSALLAAVRHHAGRHAEDSARGRGPDRPFRDTSRRRPHRELRAGRAHADRDRGLCAQPHPVRAARA